MGKLSIYDKTNKPLAKLNRKSVNINAKIYGTKIDLIRIDKYSRESFGGRPANVVGYSEKRLKFDIIANCIIKYPFEKIEVFNSLDSNNDIKSQSINLNDILPIKLTIAFNGKFETDPINLIVGDLLIDVKLDENKNKIPIIMEVMKTDAEFRGKHLIKRQADLSLVRGGLDTELKLVIKKYIEDFNL